MLWVVSSSFRISIFWLVMTPSTCGWYWHPFWSMVTESFGTSKLRSPMPSLTSTKTFASLPLSTTMVSEVLLPLQAASWLMSILEGLGAVPSKLTVPLILAAVPGSIGAELPVGLTSALGDVLCSSVVFHFLLQPVIIPAASIEA